MNKSEIIEKIKTTRSFLCVGLDSDIQKLPKHLLDFEDPIFEFNKQIIDATKDLAIAYKMNLAFYECLGVKGWNSLEKTLNYIPEGIMTIADAKRGDIGNTSSMYAQSFFKVMNFDALTVSPYMGSDSVKPFLSYKGKWVILLSLTSNIGSEDFQMIQSKNGERIFEHVLERSKQWGTDENMMYVVGATKAKELSHIRKIIPNHFLLVPGIGSQGGDLEEVAKYGMNECCGLLVNASRSILYSGDGKDFALKARLESEKIQLKMSELLSQRNF